MISIEVNPTFGLSLTPTLAYARLVIFPLLTPEQSPTDLTGEPTFLRAKNSSYSSSVVCPISPNPGAAKKKDKPSKRFV